MDLWCTMQPFKNSEVEEDELDDECSEPQSAVRAKAKPLLDQQLEKIALDWEAGRITPDEAIERMIRANGEWAARFVTPEQRAAFETLARTLFDTDPRLLRLAGRER